MDILAANELDFLVNIWSQYIYPVLLVGIGLGVVVGLHEFGHFAAAKLVGMKVECFALGFGPTIIGFKKGETEYCVKLLPLGGYVKVMGQEDFAPLTETDEPDPRSYEAQSIGARMLFIAGGVFMNVVLAALMFIIIWLVGKDFSAPFVGGTLPGWPASKVQLAWSPKGATTQPAIAPTAPDFGPGLKPGDHIMLLEGEISEEFNRRFDRIQMAAVLSMKDQTFDIQVERIDDAGRTWTGTGRLGTKTNPSGEMLVFGISPATETTFFIIKEWEVASPFEEGDKLVAVAGKPIEHAWDVSEIEPTLTGSQVTVTIEREQKDKTVRTMDFSVQPTLISNSGIYWLKDGRRIRGYRAASQEGDEENTVRINTPKGEQLVLKADEFAEQATLDILGMTPRLKIGAVVKGSRADKAGLEPGDVIVSYGVRGSPTFKQLRKTNLDNAGKKTDIVVDRDGELKTFGIVPKKRFRAERAEIGIINGMDQMSPVVAGVRKGSPAATAGLMSGDIVTQINGQNAGNWINVYNLLSDASGSELSITYRRGGQNMTAQIGTLGEDIFDPDDYSFMLFGLDTAFQPLRVKIQTSNPITALLWGARETHYLMLRTYMTLRALIGKTVSTDTLVGPAGILGLAGKVGRERPLIDFVYLMAFISATLAVINFLPLPVVDGGHAVLLLIEKVRGKPLPVKIQNIIQYAGLLGLLTVFVLLTWQDIIRYLNTLW